MSGGKSRAGRGRSAWGSGARALIAVARRASCRAGFGGKAAGGAGRASE